MTFSALLHALDQHAHLTLAGLDGSAPAYVLAQYAARHPERPLLVVTNDLDHAQALATDFAFYRSMLGPAGTSRVPQLFPAREIPYHGIPTTPEAQTARLATLIAWQTRTPSAPVIIAPVAACLQALPPPEILRTYSRTLVCGTTVDREALVYWLAEAGYTQVSLVEDVGTVAVRGALLDCWPPGAPEPVRLEFDADTITALRAFDPATQRGRHPLEQVTIGPADLLLFTDDSRRLAAQALKARADAADLPIPQRSKAMEAIQQGFRPPILEGLLPLFYPSTTTLMAHCPPDTQVILLDPEVLARTATQYAATWAEAVAAAEPIWRIVPPQESVATWNDLLTQCAAFRCCHMGVPRPPSSSGGALAENAAPTHTCHTTSFAGLRTRLRAAQADEDPLTPVAEFVRSLQEARQQITVVCHTTLAADRALDLLRWHGLPVGTAPLPANTAWRTAPASGIGIAVGALSSGFSSPDDAVAFLTEAELFGTKIRQRTARRPTTAESFVSFQDLTIGDPVVHEQHGIARYQGLVSLTLGDVPANDFVHLEYLGGDKLYLPVYRLGLLQRYIGPSDAVVALDRLGGTRWAKVKTKALHSVRTMAHELLKIYAARKVRGGTAFSGRDHLLEEFEAAFPYDETPDQWQAIEDVQRDMQHDTPMDRLVCGDVGYGKTEVAMRAAFRAAMDGKQVVLLCPTTLLAYQHAQTFAARFAGLPVRIELLSRFRTREDQKAVVAELARGTVDIIIGTHRLLQSDIACPRLGLLIIDEEQRFGVAHKERLRKLRATVDTLALTATPIPRTLHMALGGMRDISIIQTPPADRQAIRTYVVPFEDRIIREAMVRELARGGQVFFVHNRVQTILAMRDHLHRIVPEAAITVAHGQMEEVQLEDAMRAFVARETNVLLCTSIIEAGLDIPAANTLVVNRADTFGLAQLYQIRGRVGRSSVQAAAYLLIPSHADAKDGTGITAKAQRRLATLARFTELGSGFSIAMHDLEMRGAGNLLGAQQHGHIAEIGYELFTRLLERAVRNLKGEAETEAVDPEISLPVSATLPDTYVPDTNLRLVWYKRLAGCASDAALEDAERELADRFGPIPPETRQLLQVIALRVHAVQLGIDLLQYHNGVLRLRFHQSTPVDPQRMLQMVATEPKRYQFRPDGVLLVQLPFEDHATLFRDLHALLRRCGETA